MRGNRTKLDGQGLYDQIKRKVVINAAQTPRYSDIRLAHRYGRRIRLETPGIFGHVGLNGAEDAKA